MSRGGASGHLGSPLRLLIVTIDLNGGTGVFCRNLAAGLQQFFPQEFVVSLLLFRPDDVDPDVRRCFRAIHTLDATVRVDRRRLLEPLQHVMRLHDVIDRIAPDVTLTIGTYANVLVPIASPSRPTVLTAHSNTTQLLAQSRYRSVIGRLIQWRYPRRPVVTPSIGLADDLRERFGVRNTRVISHGVDLGRIRTLATEPAADLPKMPYIVACGRLTAAKDYPNLLRAYAHARQRGLVDPLVIVGSGEEEAQLRALTTDLRVAEAIWFLGYRENPYPYMKDAKLLVLSSAWEGFGLVLVEAMALGVPCLSTDCPSGPAEILGGGAFGELVPPKDSAALGNAIFELARSPQRLAFLSVQSARRAHDYSLETMSRRYRDLLVKLNATRRR